MGYIIKAPTGGGGGGDATAANQVLQLAQDATAANQLLQLAQDATETTVNDIKLEAQQTNVLLTDSLNQSVFYTTSGRSVFKDVSNTCVFLDVNDESVLKDGNLESVLKNVRNQSVFRGSYTANSDQSILNLSCENDSTASSSIIQVATFTSASFVATAGLLQAFFNTTNCVVVNISFSQSIGSHDILLCYRL
jgi:hypothetical protein